ncbi:hypothetical protein BKA59DRAFT_545777 [Fusarium tricinctum]|uniref:Uncharacterized protein n=1 Tax=Fusarium tricinctum TaxID=61284 RepID=A0A8K0RRM3_9HYPO|nr:hypothetical protein BKA59DRAFT_545777 [Fusarium tricinctum]
MNASLPSSLLTLVRPPITALARLGFADHGYRKLANISDTACRKTSLLSVLHHGICLHITRVMITMPGVRRRSNMIYAGIPTILVGLKKDLREDLIAIQEILKKSLRFVTEHKGETIARDIGAEGYLECSGLSGG